MRTRKPNKIALVLAVPLVGALLLLYNLSSSADLLKQGSLAPDFALQAADGKTYRLSEVRKSKNVVLVFYPGDNTPICTTQLCELRDNWQTLTSNHIAVLGINPANAVSHQAFADANRFPFPLLIDSDASVAQRFGCKAIGGLIKRTVYLIDTDGTVLWAKRGKPTPKEILDAIKSKPH